MGSMLVSPDTVGPSEPIISTLALEKAGCMFMLVFEEADMDISTLALGACFLAMVNEFLGSRRLENLESYYWK
jgi:hypothetical protein